MFFKNSSTWVILRLYTTFLRPTMPGTGLTVCVVGGWGGVIMYALIRLFRIKKGLRVREVFEIKQCLCRDSEADFSI